MIKNLVFDLNITVGTQSIGKAPVVAPCNGCFKKCKTIKNIKTRCARIYNYPNYLESMLGSNYIVRIVIKRGPSTGSVTVNGKIRLPVGKGATAQRVPMASDLVSGFIGIYCK
ncbi:MAG: hypothetical protein FWG18_02775 [Alphaproteobacteria bacterium]|nr:hypothetical protein [Alphaproteobacteria bacterium]